MEDIRRAYLAWITPGDVLKKMMEWIEGVQPDFHDVIGAFLQYDLLDDQYARLDQAGHTTNEKIPMSNVFVDLPFSREPETEPQPENMDRDFPNGFLGELLSAGARKLDPPSLEFPGDDPREREQVYGRYVLIGGPGQGKTTVGQFACQLYRAAILRDRPNLAPEVRDAVTGLEAHCASMKMPPPLGRRFPVRIVLNEFARRLDDKSVNSLLDYMLAILKERSSREISVEAFQKWLALYPWFLVLDGLDEVPPSSNRIQVIQAVTNFLVFANDAGTDLLVLATTRPQGYNSDFSRKYYRHRYLTPLSDRRALHYGERLASVTHGQNTTMARDVVVGPKAALESPTTARLMRSPLQVTIMATLVARGGPAPQERWVLFKRYYSVIYDRESAKRVGDVTELLRSYRTHIDSIHHRVGLTLQIESERRGQTDARLGIEELRGIVGDRLTSEGLSGGLAVEIRERIIEAASDRLVFLVGVREGQIGFEIRSLQEFMAAEALMDGPDAEAVSRLNLIAPVTHWNNVFLFAAGKCFADRQHLRSTVVDICTTLNELALDDEIRHHVLIGSQLALLLLQDGLARQQWTYEQALARSACRLRLTLYSDFVDRLAFAYHRDLRDVFEEEIRLAPDQGTALLVALADRGIDWAVALAEGPFSRRLEDYFLGEPRIHPLRLGSWQLGHVMRLLPMLGPVKGSLAFGAPEAPAWLAGMRTERAPVRLTRNGSPTSVVFEVGRIAPHEKMLTTDLLSSEAWAPVAAVLRFRSRPNCTTLAEAVRALGGVRPEDRPAFSYLYLPWPVAAISALEGAGADWDRLVEMARSGAFGNESAWLSAEKRWLTSGIALPDLEEFDRRQLYVGDYLATVGFPFTGASLEARRHGVERDPSALLDAWRRVSKRSKPLIADWICRDESTLYAVGRAADSAELRDLISDWSMSDGYLDLGAFGRLASSRPRDELMLDAAEQVGRSGRFYHAHGQVGAALVGDLYDVWLRDRSRVGILLLCVWLRAYGANAELPTNSFRWDHLRADPRSGRSPC